MEAYGTALDEHTDAWSGFGASSFTLVCTIKVKQAVSVIENYTCFIK